MSDYGSSCGDSAPYISDDEAPPPPKPVPKIKLTPTEVYFQNCTIWNYSYDKLFCTFPPVKKNS